MFGYKAGCLTCLLGGATILPKAVFDLDDVLETVAREAMANYKVPRAVEIVEELPVNATGKVEKETLRARAAARAGRA